MFTGIIEEMGEVISLETRDDMTLWDGSKGKGTECVNGVCLTATEIDEDAKTFKVGLAPETLRKTNLGTYVPESKQRVNMERASEIGGRNSGHFVQGHVDNVGTIMDQWIDENSLFFKIAFPYEFMRYVVPKGFIAIDGTVRMKIILPSKKVGDTVNVEVMFLANIGASVGAFVPKMEALETKVKQLEARLQELEGGESTASSSATDNDVNYGQPIGGLSNVAAAATAPTPEQVKVKNTDGTEWSPGWSRWADDPSLDWVRIQGGG
ncbi:riboflavin synthase [Skeletonema marinoi]|uniref:Riboflavin synthase n=1 Tax=Skeletonema marinoi TaxID=267567 RepID=A0AAD8YDG6_9STRA|nr:riboflavin synthase [Skeletonema marinoi]